MRKNILVAVLFALFPLSAYAGGATKVPVSGRGYDVADSSVIGKDTGVNSSSTTATLVCTGECLLYGVQLSSAAITEYVVLRDTATANVSSTKKVEYIYFNATPVNTGPSLPYPIRFQNGISVNTSVDSSGEVTVFYKDLD